MWNMEQIHESYGYSWWIMQDNYGLILAKGAVPCKPVGSKLGLINIIIFLVIHFMLCVTNN